MNVTVPSSMFGDSITEATVAEWTKSEGDYVEEDDILVELETDKITVGFPSPISGVLRVQRVATDDTVMVGDIIAEIDPADRPASNDTSTSAERADTSEEAGGISPAVRRLIDEHSINPRDIKGSGPGGRILKGDVLKHLENKQQSKSTPPPTPKSADRGTVQVGEEPTERVKMSKLRQTVAKRLVEAQQTAAMLTTFNEVDMSAVMALRSQYKQKFVDKYETKLGFMSFFVKAAISALKQYPAVNSEIDGDSIVYKSFYHIGVAVGGPRGLVVPVIKHADRLGFADVENEIGRLARKVQENRVSLADLQGGTFTISNGGIYGSMLSTPILNPPQVGILGMHNIVERAVVVDGEVQVRPIMYLALSYDHRIIDGKEAVSFLVRIKECIENPERILLEI